MARLRAVVVIHAPGLGGNPVCGQRSTAVVKASCTASSARSISPKRRIRVATQRPYSARKTRSMSAGEVTGPLAGVILERADLDRGTARPGGLRGPGERRVEVGGLDHPEAAEVFFGLRERAVDREDLTALYADHGGRGRGVQPSGEDPCPFRLQLAVERIDVGEGLPHLLGRRELLALDVVHGQHVLLHDPPPSWFRHPTGRFTLLRCRLRVLAPCRPR